MINASPRPAWLCSRVTALGQVRRDLPAATMAERAGVSPAGLRAVIADNPDAMPPVRKA